MHSNFKEVVLADEKTQWTTLTVEQWYGAGPRKVDAVAILFRTHGDKSNRSLLEVCSMSKPAMKGYPAEFKERAVKLAVESEQPIAQTARDLGVNENTLHTWIGKYHRAVRQEKEVNGEHLYEELKRLRKENARLKEERDILKKAAAYFAQQLP
jgi:transposase